MDKMDFETKFVFILGFDGTKRNEFSRVLNPLVDRWGFENKNKIWLNLIKFTTMRQLRRQLNVGLDIYLPPSILHYFSYYY